MGHGRFSSDGAEFPATEAAPLEPLFTPSHPSAIEESRPPTPRPADDEGAISTFLYARLHNFTAACSTVAGPELTAFVNEARRMLSSAALKLGGEIAQRRPDSILCVFTHNPKDRVPTHAKRGLHAAILTVHEAMQLAARIGPQLEAAGVPPLWIAVGVHLGAGEVTPRASNAERMVHATGEAVEIARLLEGVAADLRWGLVASAGTRLAAGTRVESGRSATIGLPDESFLELTEISGLVARAGSTTPPSHYAMLRESLLLNQQIARASAGAPTGSGNLLIEDYRVLRKIGEGGNASVYLAQPVGGGPTQVLKVMRMDGPEGDAGLQRFLQEYALLSGIDHPNVAHFFRQGFSAGSAYIAMEYFPLGDLRSRIRRLLDPAIALYYLRQIAAGLEAIHHANIVHRDLKPDNIMVRQDGIVAITDFGVAKQVSMLITDTGAGEVVGTPYYLSPEQAQGHRVDARSDLYSLGVLAYEMLTGNKPYHATTTHDLLRLHVEAPVPALPPQHRHLQPVLDRLMAKDPQQRYASAGELLDDLDRLQA
ncbi:protein kinase [Ramlibacter tataouinensis]|uniref:protein kinase domain-containing protein n=1 Tax=Ramlibacter tataouinensis TaxID=94132 RepID=UPI0022F3F69F|nr:protein kinase [Ramlibacter tataouinensis]WBY02465.1 protein kinase [Ramlibacter tataouinensis]